MSWMKVCVAIPFFITMLLPGCVSQSTYDRAHSDLTTAQQLLTATTADRDATKTQLSRALSDLITAQQLLTAVTGDRDATKAQLSKVQSDLTTAQQSIATMNSSFKTSQLYVDIARAYLNLAAAGSGGSSTDADVALSQMRVGLSAVNDSALNAAWDALVANNASNASNGAFVKLLAQRLSETKPRIN